MFRILKKQDSFNWTQECEDAFKELKVSLASPPVLTKPIVGDTLILYLAVTDEAVSAVLIREKGKGQFPIYFVSKALQGVDLNYQRLEKVAFALLIASRKLRPYFQCYPILVRTNQPIRQILHKPDLAGRMMSWAIELTLYDISYEPRLAIKAQVLADFLAEMMHPGQAHPGEWMIYVDGSSNTKGCGARVILENSDILAIEYSLKFDFPTSNNQTEYEACLAGIRMAKDLGANVVTICSDSKLVVS
jgi:hypothetical protein